VKQNVFILFFALLSLIGSAQIKDKGYFDLGLFAGGSYYIGDINPNKHFRFSNPAGGIIARYNFSRRAALRAGFNMGSIEGSDSKSSSNWQQQRNLSFRSSLQEINLLFEFNFLDFKIGGSESQRISPFVFLGFGGYHFKPQAKLNDNWVNLQPLGTEGQELPQGASEKKYKLTQIALPIGIGAKIALGKNFCLGAEWGMRKTFTDYLDDVSTLYYNPIVLDDYNEFPASALADPSTSTKTNTGKQRGDNSNNDWYSFFGLTLTMKLERKKTCEGALKLGGS
jgi:hypothetical protein